MFAQTDLDLLPERSTNIAGALHGSLKSPEQGELLYYSSRIVDVWGLSSTIVFCNMGLPNQYYYSTLQWQHCSSSTRCPRCQA